MSVEQRLYLPRQCPSPQKQRASVLPNIPPNYVHGLINIDKANQKMTVSLDGVNNMSGLFQLASGYRTPSGNYTARSINKIWTADSGTMRP